MISEATVMSKPASRGKPLAAPPSEQTIERKRPVVHVQHPAPAHPARVQIPRVAPVDVVVDHGGQEIVRRGDGVEVAGEMQVDVLHGHHLGVAAAGRAPLHAEAGPERGLADGDHGLLADLVQAVAQPHRGRGLAFARRRRRHRRHQDQLAVGARAQRAHILGPQLGLVGPVLQQRVPRHLETRPDLPDRAHRGRARYLNVGLHGHRFSPRTLVAMVRPPLSAGSLPLRRERGNSNSLSEV